MPSNKNSNGAVFFLYIAFICFAVAAFGFDWRAGLLTLGLESLSFCLGYELLRRDAEKRGEHHE